jgi:hypothetical protein
MFWATPSARPCRGLDAIVPSVVLSVMPSARRFHTYGAIDLSVISSAAPSVRLPGRGNHIGPSGTSSDDNAVHAKRLLAMTAMHSFAARTTT